MFFQLIFAVCQPTTECNTIQDYCKMDEMHSNRALDTVNQETIRICNQECAQQYYDAYNCMQQNEMANTCKDEWNMRCSIDPKPLTDTASPCMNEFVKNLQMNVALKFKNEQELDTNLINPLPVNPKLMFLCTDCSKQLILYTQQYETHNQSATKWSSFMKNNALTSCGTQFLDNFQISSDFTNFLKPQTQTSQNLILIIGISISALVLLLIIFFAYRRYMGKPPLGVVEQELHFLTSIDFRFVWTILDPRPFFIPLTRRKVVLYLLYIAIGIVLSGVFGYLPDGFYYFKQVANFSVIAAIVQIIIDPLLIIVTIFTCKYDSVHPIESIDPRSRDSQEMRELNSVNQSAQSSNASLNGSAPFISRGDMHSQIAVVICTHNSAAVIEETIHAALNHFNPDNIYIADNGFSELPMDHTKQLIHAIHPDIVYRYYNIGNKTLAQYLTVRYIHKTRRSTSTDNSGMRASQTSLDSSRMSQNTTNATQSPINYVLVIDDDVSLPLNIHFPLHQLSGNVKALAYPIRGVDYELQQARLFTKWQDMEYKLCDFIRLFQDKYCSILHPHGAISLWHKDVLLRMLHDSDSIFYADDVKMGKWLLQHGFKLGYVNDCIVDT
eukprot:NODE_274_length_10990_cov_0.767606.p1 type:complete len:611 gc:universal NODE_274_length_10990_cov_0.767606:4484-6316(+)